MAGNDGATWNSYSNGRVSSVRYGYAALDLDRGRRLGAGTSWHSHLSAILTGSPLPDPERLSLGGLDAVRGYGFDDASVEAGAIWRNEVRLPGFGLRASGRDRLRPYLFVDIASGQDRASGTSTTLVARGLGVDYAAGGLTATVTAGQALRSAGNTRAHDWTVLARLTARF
ncbi:ShlB/FhaC/HecB family hemolysin secretion/activation protein [Acidimangrovimonas pyrenivorans]|uniref:ShlB/FhaC/HecB family hemolysin secretion/activation protein n=1 Tax=Acidimangrovimonas pyrenivorans TaxID=2030798 RepID=A0ABV7ALM2_9RHOB